MTTLVMIVCLLTPAGTGCVRITELAPSETACRARAAQIEAGLAGDPDALLIGALVACQGPTT